MLVRGLAGELEGRPGAAVADAARDHAAVLHHTAAGQKNLYRPARLNRRNLKQTVTT